MAYTSVDPSNSLREVDITCPHCGKEIELSLDSKNASHCVVVCPRCLHTLEVRECLERLAEKPDGR